MKVNPNDPAFPPMSSRVRGMNLRTWMATQIMAAHSANYNRASKTADADRICMADDAVRLTDTLIERLNRECAT